MMCTCKSLDSCVRAGGITGSIPVPSTIKFNRLRIKSKAGLRFAFCPNAEGSLGRFPGIFVFIFACFVRVLCTYLWGSVALGHRAKDETIVVSDGLSLKEMDGVFHCYFRLNGKQFHKSTKTNKLAPARLDPWKGIRIHLRKVDAGKTSEVISFTRLKRFDLEYIRRQSKYAYHFRTIDRHFLPCFVKFEDISKIKKADITDMTW